MPASYISQYVLKQKLVLEIQFYFMNFKFLQTEYFLNIHTSWNDNFFLNKILLNLMILFPLNSSDFLIQNTIVCKRSEFLIILPFF